MLSLNTQDIAFLVQLSLVLIINSKDIKNQRKIQKTQYTYSNKILDKKLITKEMINQTIQDLICNQKGILNLGYMMDSPKILQNLNNNQENVKYLVDMIIQSSDNSQYYNSIILNYNQLQESLTDRRYQSIEDKTYLNFKDNFDHLGLNFREDDDIQLVIQEKDTYNYEIINFKVNYMMLEQCLDEDQQNNNNQIQQQLDNTLQTIGQNIKQFQQIDENLIYIVDFNIIYSHLPKQNNNELIQQLERKLYSFCTQTLLTNDIPLENIVISLNLPLLGQKFPNKQPQTHIIEEQAFNSLMFLSHSLPAAIGGVVFTYDSRLDVNTFSNFLNQIFKMKVISYFPYTYMTHTANFEHLSEIWSNIDKNYMLTYNHFIRCSESFESGLNEQLVVGQIEVGSIAQVK